MAAYASSKRESLTRIRPNQPAPLQLAPVRAGCRPEAARCWAGDREGINAALIRELVDRLAERIATELAERLGPDERDADDWLDCRHAAEYLGVHRDTLRKLAAERAIPSEQNAPGCKLYFRRSDLDALRRCSGRPWHLAANLASAA
jgi:excisionase family DNA binding protein